MNERIHTSLHVAAGKGQPAAIEALAAAGADLHAKDDYGYTPLHVAAGKGQPAAIEALATAGADVNEKTSGGAPLHVAAGKGQPAAIKALVAAGADVNEKGGYGLTPLHFAAGKGQPAAIKALAAAGADLHAKNDHDFTPLHIAAGNDQPAAYEALEMELAAEQDLALARMYSPDDNSNTGRHVVFRDPQKFRTLLSRVGLTRVIFLNRVGKMNDIYVHPIAPSHPRRQLHPNSAVSESTLSRAMRGKRIREGKAEIMRLELQAAACEARLELSISLEEMGAEFCS